MRFSTDDGRFGFVVTPLAGKGMYRFQLIVGGELVGDDEANIIDGAMKRLRNPKMMDDDRLGPVAVDPTSVMAAIDADDDLYDATTLQVAESLDEWNVNGFVHEGNVTVFAQRNTCRGAEMGPLLVSTTSSAEYSTIVEEAYDYWIRDRNNDRRAGS